MRKITLAKLTQDDSDRLITLESNICSFKTLLENQFLEHGEKEKIQQKLRDLLTQKDQLLQDFIGKYKLPYFANNNYHISPTSQEIFLEVFD